MTPRALACLAYIRENDSSPFACFGPVLRDQTRAFVGGGVVTRDEYKWVINAAYQPAPVSADAAEQARHKAHRAHDSAVRRNT